MLLSWCRLCLKRSENFLSLLDSKILNKIESLTSLKFDLNDKLPQNCCQSCVDNVITSYNFQQLVVESDKWLREGGNLNNHEIIQSAYSAPETYEVCQDDENYFRVEPKLEFDKSEPAPIEEDSGQSDVVLQYLKVEDFVNRSADTIINVEYDNFTANSSGSFASDSGISNNTPLDLESSDKSSDIVVGAFPCSDCNLRFSTKRNLQKHKMKHNVEQCPHCPVTMRRDNLKRHIQKHSDLPITCEICGTVAKNRESLRGHINYHHKNNPIIKCEICPKEFKSRHHYNTHKKKVHMNIRNAQCEICGHKFFANHDLHKHIRMKHNKERPYPCEQCLKYFSSNYALKTHMRQHSGEKPFTCELCGTAFKQKVSLNNHLYSRHNVEANQTSDIC